MRASPRISVLSVLSVMGERAVAPDHCKTPGNNTLEEPPSPREELPNPREEIPSPKEEPSSPREKLPDPREELPDRRKEHSRGEPPIPR